jgi:RND family efflux transporter MFP subunit
MKLYRPLQPATLLAVLFLAQTTFAQSMSLPFDTALAKLESAPLERVYDGRVEAVNRATVSAQTAGRVASISYDVDDYVEAGSEILRFTDVEQQAALRRAEAALNEASARAREASKELKRVGELVDKGSVSKREYDGAVANVEAAGARENSARSAVREAQQQLEYTIVRAPYPGIVTERHVEAGETVNVGQPLMSGLSLDALRVTADIPQRVAAEVRSRKLAFVITDDGRIEPTKLTIFPFANESTNTFRVRLELPPGHAVGFPGMFVKVAFVVGDSQRLLIPESALARRSEVSGVYVVDDMDAVRFHQVRTGNRFADQVEILSGLQVGERVATDTVAAAIHIKSLAAKKQ